MKFRGSHPRELLETVPSSWGFWRPQWQCQVPPARVRLWKRAFLSAHLGILTRKRKMKGRARGPAVVPSVSLILLMVVV